MPRPQMHLSPRGKALWLVIITSQAIRIVKERPGTIDESIESGGDTDENGPCPPFSDRAP